MYSNTRISLLAKIPTLRNLETKSDILIKKVRIEVKQVLLTGF